MSFQSFENNYQKDYLKVQYKEEIKLIINKFETLKELQMKLYYKFNLKDYTFTLKYLDKENEKILIEDDEDLAIFQKLKILKLILEDKINKLESQTDLPNISLSKVVQSAHIFGAVKNVIPQSIPYEKVRFKYQAKIFEINKKEEEQGVDNEAFFKYYNIKNTGQLQFPESTVLKQKQQQQNNNDKNLNSNQIIQQQQQQRCVDGQNEHMYYEVGQIKSNEKKKMKIEVKKDKSRKMISSWRLCYEEDNGSESNFPLNFKYFGPRISIQLNNHIQ